MIGVGARRAGTIFIRRNRLRDVPRVLAVIKARSSAGQRVTWFPEATSSNGRGVLPFKSGLFQSAVDLDVPIASISIAANDDRACWYDDQSLVANLWALARAPELTLTLTFCCARAIDRKTLARQTRQALVCRGAGVVSEAPRAASAARAATGYP